MRWFGSNRTLVISVPKRNPSRRYRFVPLRFDVEDPDCLRAGDVLALLFLADVFLADVFLAEDFLAEDFLAEDFLADDDRAGDFLAGDFLARLFADVFAPAGRFPGDLPVEDDFFVFCFRWRARAVPPTAAPSAAAPVAASIGFSATVVATFFAPDPTAETASPAFSTTVEIVDPPSFTSSFRSFC
jgi:hypothetical protein